MSGIHFRIFFSLSFSASIHEMNISFHALYLRSSSLFHPFRTFQKIAVTRGATVSDIWKYIDKEHKNTRKKGCGKSKEIEKKENKNVKKGKENWFLLKEVRISDKKQALEIEMNAFSYSLAQGTGD